MTFLDLLLNDADEFDEGEATNLPQHVREEKRRHRRLDRKLTLLIWMVVFFFASFMIDAPALAKVVVAAMLR